MSGRVGTPTYMTIAQLQALQAAGDEIGGHTINHPDLAELSDSAAREEVCGDRAALQADGLDVTDFAYPYGEFNNATPAIVRSCGYQSARGVGGVEPQGGCYDICLYAETVPPAEPFDTRTENSVLYSTTLSTIEGYVIHAERAGGWVQIIFHYVCDRCNEYSVSEPTLAAFLNWLAPRSAQGTVVETVRQVIQTPFVPAAVLVLAPHAPPLHLLASRSCPATPVTARCAAIPGRRVSAIRLGPREPLRLATAPATENIRLRQRHHGVLAAKRTSAASAGGAVRWRLPATCERHGEATIAVHYPLGVAYYRFRLAPCAAARRRQS